MRKAISLAICLVLTLIMLSGCGGSSESSSSLPAETGTTAEVTTTQTETTTEATTTEAITTTKSATTNVNDIDKIRDAISEQVGAGEEIINIEYRDRELWISVDLGENNTLVEPLAESRTSSITDSLLELEELDSTWDKIVVDFKDVGYIENDKSNIKSNEYGRYFDPINFEIKTDSTSGETKKYVGNKNTMKFHLPNCDSVSRMDPSVMEESDDKQKLIDQGYSGCNVCNP